MRDADDQRLLRGATRDEPANHLDVHVTLGGRLIEDLRWAHRQHAARATVRRRFPKHPSVWESDEPDDTPGPDYVWEYKDILCSDEEDGWDE